MRVGPLFDHGPYAGLAWRLVEAQHVVSTTKLVDTADEQALLEDVIEAVKPPVPPRCRGLHYLLSTPFRYGAPYPHGSRFRRAGYTEGVWYGSEAVSTAVAELAFYRLLFFAESPQTPWPHTVSAYTAFAAELATDRHTDLSAADYDDRRAALEHVADYAACQQLADAARGTGAGLIRYRSVRDRSGFNIAVLDCGVFSKAAPTRVTNWRMRIAATGIIAIGEGGADRLSFDQRSFAGDPRIDAMIWDR